MHSDRSDFDDWEALLDLITRAFAGMQGRINPPSSANALTPDGLRQRAASDVLLLRHRGDALVGCLFCKPQSDALYLGKLAVDPAAQGTGIGRSLVDEAADVARRLCLPRLRLETRIELVENHRAFARMGFAEVGRSAHPGFDRPTSIMMERALARGIPAAISSA